MSEHVEDFMSRMTAEVEAREHGSQFFEEVGVEMLQQLILTYSDVDAARMLEALRERFWTQDFQARKRKLARKPKNGGSS